MNLNQAYLKCRKLMNEHGLDPIIWQFKWSPARRMAGYCQYKTRKLNGEHTVLEGWIALSKAYVEDNSEEAVTDTILHEIAHALTPGHGHDHVWRLACVKIGAKPDRCYNPKEVVTRPRWVYSHSCGFEAKRYRAMTNVDRRYCPRCGLNSVGQLQAKKVD
jgi:predicted SprT family Zn-dependent metalloprotease